MQLRVSDKKKSGAIKLKPHTSLTRSFVMDYALCRRFVGVTTTLRCVCPLLTLCFRVDESFWKHD